MPGAGFKSGKPRTSKFYDVKLIIPSGKVGGCAESLCRSVVLIWCKFYLDGQRVLS